MTTLARSSTPTIFNYESVSGSGEAVVANGRSTRYSSAIPIVLKNRSQSGLQVNAILQHEFRLISVEAHHPSFRQPQSVVIDFKKMRGLDNTPLVMLLFRRGELSIYPLKPMVSRPSKCVRQALGLLPKNTTVKVDFQGKKFGLDLNKPRVMVELFGNKMDSAAHLYYPLSIDARSEVLATNVNALYEGLLAMALNGAKAHDLRRHVEAVLEVLGEKSRRLSAPLLDVLLSKGMSIAQRAYQIEYELERPFHERQDHSHAHQASLECRAWHGVFGVLLRVLDQDEQVGHIFRKRLPELVALDTAFDLMESAVLLVRLGRVPADDEYSYPGEIKLLGDEGSVSDLDSQWSNACNTVAHTPSDSENEDDVSSYYSVATTAMSASDYSTRSLDQGDFERIRCIESLFTDRLVHFDLGGRMINLQSCSPRSRLMVDGDFIVENPAHSLLIANVKQSENMGELAAQLSRCINHLLDNHSALLDHSERVELKRLAALYQDVISFRASVDNTLAMQRLQCYLKDPSAQAILFSITLENHPCLMELTRSADNTIQLILCNAGHLGYAAQAALRFGLHPAPSPCSENESSLRCHTVVFDASVLVLQPQKASQFCIDLQSAIKTNNYNQLYMLLGSSFSSENLATLQPLKKGNFVIRALFAHLHDSVSTHSTYLMVKAHMINGAFNALRRLPLPSLSELFCAGPPQAFFTQEHLRLHYRSQYGAISPHYWLPLLDSLKTPLRLDLLECIDAQQQSRKPYRYS